MAWQTPKTDWASSDNPGPGDFNRIEKNIVFLLMQQPVNIGNFSGNASLGSVWNTLFTYDISLPEGISLPIKVFPGLPENLTFTGSIGGDAIFSFRALVNGSVVGASGVEVSDDFTVAVQGVITNEGSGGAGTYSAGSWVTNSYRY
jgi:hypothetical protein